MKTYTINKTFATQEECDAWEEKNCPNRTYNGQPIIMIGHQEEFGKKQVILTDITTI